MTPNLLRDRLADRIQQVETRLRAACQRAGRARGEVTLVAVTKTVPVEVAALALELGVLDLGENRPQELWSKAAALPPSVRWHAIGHLQRNKIERTLPLAHLIHSVDSLRLLSALDAESAGREKPLDVLLEVNASQEASKHGFAPAEVPLLGSPLRSLRHVRVRGLMTMAAPEEDPECCRPTFAALRRLRDQLRDAVGPPHDWSHLSMGMSGDFEVAVEEGSTFVRLGTVLFEGLA
ncbi:MAG: YggS family pyridoxal phosphate-dependent enzyme [Gemmataceae bacterium]|nr:YggS family pyridoxal phosphate-dependent enzyme [Gemmataceae bacterium]